MTQTQYTKSPDNKILYVTREFAAAPEQVWHAWTDSQLLDQWWAPKPWKAQTKTMQFEEGGTWLYCMEGPEGEKSWNQADFKNIQPQTSYETVDSFCDEEGNVNPDFPRMYWTTTFTPSNAGTRVDIGITFPTQADLEKIVEMGFETGFAAAHENLDALLK
ncbi:SRPBCC family protein [Telluribacter humicola]|uniref:SRPBCC family protein n=1 Tax=Telluribacter humicola TaxID=1720261 RepID=UPI001A95AA04|nr:SRPBCC domain-containing protein [Telluribacter humicola]